ncbi:MAG TPA: hypothetical protein VHA07_06145 [Devosia sp.]|nr:hypothetical protein [Devosia sp.]
MASPARRNCLLLVLLGALALSGCARPVGDFGRAEADPVHDRLMPLAGTARASLAGEPVSAFNLSDQEREMRDRIWRYLVAPHAFDWFGASIVELQRTRLLPVSGKGPRIDRYYDWLHRQSFASSRTRYARIGDDVTVDIEMMPSAFASICAVLEVDRQRGVAANGLADLDEATRRDAAARQAENDTQIDWFTAAVRNRYESYSYALDHLLVETPHQEAVRVNGLLSELAADLEQAERGDFCAGGGAAFNDGAAAEIPSRELTPRQPALKGS